MATISAITTGEQAVTSTGAITGTLSVASQTAGLTFTVKVRVRNLSAGQSVNIGLEGTVNAFSTTVVIATFQFIGTGEPEGAMRSVVSYDIPSSAAAYFGVSGGTFRLNCYAISAGTADVLGTLEV